MRTAGAVILVAVATVVAGCGGSHARRDAVNRYFDRVDAAQAQVRREAVPIEKAFAHFSSVRNTQSETHALVHAHAVLERALTNVQLVRPPADATPVYTDLVRLYGLQAGVAAELVAMTRFVPQYDAALVPLKPTHATLVSDLKAAKGWAKIGKAFERYRLALAGVVARLGRLSAPSTLRPAFEAERSTLARSVGLCTSIEAALAQHDAKRTSTGIRALSGLGTEKAVVRARRDQIAAAKAYNARLTRIASLAAKIGRERDKLVLKLG